MSQITVNAYVDKTKKEENVSLDQKSTVKQLLEKLKINPVTVIISRNNELILEDEELNDKDKIKIMSVISGG